MDTNHPLYIGALDVSNRRAARRIIIAGAWANELVGPNEGGKSSALDSAEENLRGSKSTDVTPLRNGARKGPCVLDLVAQLIEGARPNLRITRTKTPKNATGSLSIKDSGGKDIKTPKGVGDQGFLNMLFDGAIFNPVDIASRRPGEAAAKFQARVSESMELLAGAGFVENKARLTTELADVVERRKVLKRQVSEFGDMAPPPKATRVDPSAIKADLDAAKEINRKARLAHDDEKDARKDAELLHERAAAAVERGSVALRQASLAMDGKLDEYRETCISAKSATDQASATYDACNYGTHVKKWADAEELAGNMKDISKEAGEAQDAVGVADNAHCDAVHAVEKLAPLPEVHEPTYKDTAPIEERLMKAGETNAAATKRATYDADLLKLEALSDELTQVEEKADALKQDLLDMVNDTDIPIPGLEWSEDGISVDGVTWEQLSSGRRWMLAVELAININERAERPLKVLFIREGGLIDDKIFGEIAAYCKQRGYQLWMETPRIAHKGDHQVIIIEEGEVSEIRTAEPADAADESLPWDDDKGEA